MQDNHSTQAKYADVATCLKSAVARNSLHGQGNARMALTFDTLKQRLIIHSTLR